MKYCFMNILQQKINSYVVTLFHVTGKTVNFKEPFIQFNQLEVSFVGKCVAFLGGKKEPPGKVYLRCVPKNTTFLGHALLGKSNGPHQKGRIISDEPSNREQMFYEKACDVWVCVLAILAAWE